MAYDFIAEDPFSFATTGIELESSSESDSLDNAVALDLEGEPVADSDKTFNEKTAVTATYKCSELDTITDATVVLGGAGPLVVESVQVQYSNTGHCTITLSGHNHGTTAHEATNAFTVTLPTLGFGAYDPLGNTPSTACQSASWSASIMKHVDRLNNQGAFLAGASRGCKIEASAEYLGAAPALASDWTKSGDDDNTSNSDFQTSSLKAYKYQAADEGT